MLFAKKCLTSYIEICIVEGQVLNMPCPNSECYSETPEDLIKQLVSDEIFQKYLFFKTIEELSKNPCLRWCPKPDCKGFDIGNLDKKQLTCNVCEHNYCYYCVKAWHPKKKCKASSDIEMDKWARNHGLKYCPNCRSRVQKTHGSDHIICVRCKYDWCWLCGDEYTESHFKSCEALKAMKKDVSYFIVFRNLFSLILLVFFPLAFAVYKVHRNTGIGYRLRNALNKVWLSYIIAVLLGIISLPLYYALGPIVLSIWISVKFKEKCCKNYDSKSDKDGNVAAAGVIAGIICIALVLAGAIIALIIVHIIGIGQLIYKIFICLRRCRDPYYLRPKFKYTYL